MATAPRNGEHTGSAPPTLHTVLEAWSAVQQELEPQVQAMQKELGGSRWLGGGKKSATIAKLQELVSQSAASLQGFREAAGSHDRLKPQPTAAAGPSEAAAPRTLDINGLQRELDEVIAQKQKLAEQIQSQSSELTNLKAQLRETIEAARQETEHKERLMEQIDMMQQTGAKLNVLMEERFTKQQNAIEWSWRVAKMLETQVVALQNEIEPSKSAVKAKLQEAMTRLQAAVSAKERECAKAELKVKDATIERLKSEMSASGRELEQARDDGGKNIDGLKDQVDLLQKTLADMRKAHESELQAMSKTLEDERKTSKTLLSDLKEKASELGNANQSLQTAQAKFDELTDAAVREAQAKAELEAQIVRFKVDSENSKQNGEQNASAKEKEQRKLASDLAKVRDERDRVRSELDALKKDYSQSKSKWEEEVKAANATIKKLTSDMDASQGKSTEMDVEVKKIREETVRLENTLRMAQETAKKNEEISQTELQVKNSTIDKLKADIASIQGSAADVEKKLRADLTKSDAELAAARKKIEDLTQRLVSESKERKKTAENVTKSDSESARLKADLEKKTQELSQAAKECEACRTELKSKDSAIEKLKSEVSDMQCLRTEEGKRALVMAQLLETQVADLQQEVTPAKAAAIAKVRAALQRVQVTVKAKERARTEMEAELQSKNQTIERLKTEFAKMESSVSAASDMEKKLRVELTKVGDELIAARKEVDELTQRAVSEGKERQKLGQTLAKYESGEASLKAELDKKLQELAAAVGELKKQKLALDKAGVEIQNTKDEAAKQLEQTHAKYESGEASLKAELDKKTQELAAAVGELKEQKLALDKAGVEIQNTKDEAAQQIEAEREESKKKCREIESQLQALASELDGQQQSVPMVKREAGKAQRAAAPPPPNLNEEKGQQPAKAHETDEMVKSLKAQVMDKESETQRLHGQVAKLEHALQDAQSLVEKSNKILADRDSEVEKARASVKGLEDKVDRLTTEGERDKQDLVASEAKLRETSQLLDLHFAEISKLQEELQSTQIKLKAFEDDVQKNASVASDLDSTIKKLRKEVSAKDKALQDSKQAVSEGAKLASQATLTIANKDAELAALKKKLEESDKSSEDAASRAENFGLVNKAKQKLSEQLKIKDEELQLLEGEVRSLKTSIRDIEDQSLLRTHQHAKEMEEVKAELQKMQDVQNLSELEFESTERVAKSNALVLSAKQSELQELQQQYELLSAEKERAEEALELSLKECDHLKVKVANLEDAAEKVTERRAFRPESAQDSTYSSPSSRTLAVEQLRATELLENVLRCKEVIRLLSQNIQKDLLHVEPSVQVSDQSRRSTVGIMFDGKGTVESVLIGGPAHASRKIRKGDRIVKVNGIAMVGPSLLEALQTPDIPGTSVALTVHRPSTGEFEEVRIKRISTAQIAAKRKIFDNFSHLHDKFKRGRDHEAVRYLQETMDLWEDQLIQQFDHEATVLGTWTTFQKVSTRWTSELAELLETIHTLGSTADEEEDDDDVLQPLPAMLFSKPEKMSNHRSPSKKTHTEAVLLQSCGALCSSLDEHLRVNMANDADNASQSGTKSTLGIKYNPSSLQIEALEVGGPAFNCGKMKKGDVLLKVNDEDVKTNNVERLLRGDDMPGSTLRLELRCAETHQESYVSLTRMPTGVLGDSMRMSELFACLKEQVVGYSDMFAEHLLDECIELWASILEASARKGERMQRGVQDMQYNCLNMVSDLKDCVNKLSLSLGHNDADAAAPEPYALERQIFAS